METITFQADHSVVGYDRDGHILGLSYGFCQFLTDFGESKISEENGEVIVKLTLQPDKKNQALALLKPWGSHFTVEQAGADEPCG